MTRLALLVLSLALAAPAVSAQTVPFPLTGGTQVVVPAFGKVTRPNDEARVTLMVEEQDRDRALAVSRVNQKMRQGADLVRREDPHARLATRSYYTYPVYAEDGARPSGKVRQPIAWRVGQHLELKTTDLQRLPKTVASAQTILALHSLQFGLSDAARKNLDRQVIEAAYLHLEDRLAAIATAMGRKRADALLEQVDFSGADEQPRPLWGDQSGAKAEMALQAVRIEEPGFEPGETTLQMHITGKVRFP